MSKAKTQQDKKSHHKNFGGFLKSDTAKLVESTAKNVALNLAVGQLQTVLINYINENNSIDQEEKTGDISKLQTAFSNFRPSSAKQDDIADFAIDVMKIVFNLDDHDIFSDIELSIVTEIIDDIKTIMNKKSTAADISDAIEDLTQDLKEAYIDLTNTDRTTSAVESTTDDNTVALGDTKESGTDSNI